MKWQYAASHPSGENIFINNMRHSFIIFAAAVAATAVACTPKASEKTTLNITLGADSSAVNEVSIAIKALDYDTTFTVADKKASIDLPVTKTAVASLTCGSFKTAFVPDGTALSIEINDEESEVVSKTPETSVNEKFKAYRNGTIELQKTFKEKLEALGENPSEEEANKIYEEYDKASTEFVKNAFEANKDNVVGIDAFRNYQYELSAEQVDSILQTMDSVILAEPAIQRIQKGNTAKLTTAEGKMFTDFEVDGVKFSDYVGKGKYMLVDFWASWCGPCKREIPNIKKVYEKYAGKDFDVLSVAVWDKPEATRDTAKVYGVNWNEIVNAQTIPTDLYGIQGIPHIMLVGPDGTILKRDLRGEAIEAEVAKYVTAKK